MASMSANWCPCRIQHALAIAARSRRRQDAWSRQRHCPGEGRDPAWAPPACLHVTMPRCVASGLVLWTKCLLLGGVQQVPTASMLRPRWAAVCPATNVTALNACLAWLSKTQQCSTCLAVVVAQAPRGCGWSRDSCCLIWMSMLLCPIGQTCSPKSGLVIARAEPLSHSGWTRSALCPSWDAQGSTWAVSGALI